MQGSSTGPLPGRYGNNVSMRYTVLAFLCLATVIAYVQRRPCRCRRRRSRRDLGLGPAGHGHGHGGVVLGVRARSSCRPAGSPTGSAASRRWSCSRSLWSVLTGLTGARDRVRRLAGLLWSLMGLRQAGHLPVCHARPSGRRSRAPGRRSRPGCSPAAWPLGAAVAPTVTGQAARPVRTGRQILALYCDPGARLGGSPVRCSAGARGRMRTAAVPTGQPTGRRSPTASAAWSQLVTDRQMQLLCGQQFLRAAAIAFFYTWFPRFLQETAGVDAAGVRRARGVAAAGRDVRRAGRRRRSPTGCSARPGTARLSRQGMAVVGHGRLHRASALAAYFVDGPDVGGAAPEPRRRSAGWSAG